MKFMGVMSDELGSGNKNKIGINNVKGGSMIKLN
jgi:hypothetical protein